MLRIIAFTCILFLTVGYQAQAQEDVLVTVWETSVAHTVAGLTVTLSNPELGTSQQLVTDAAGRVLFKGIIAGTGYTVATKQTEVYAAVVMGPFEVVSQQPKVVDLFVTPVISVNLETAVVSGTATTQINRTDAEVRFELKGQEIRQLPVEGRDMTRVLFRLPNVSQATGFYPEAPTVSINGANSLFTSYLIDGMDNNERFLGGQKFAIPVGAARNVTVLTNNYSAEYGLTANGVVNITTKAGSNTWSGEAFVVNRPGPAIDGRPELPQRDLSGNVVLNGFRRYQTGFGVGGPLVRDRTFFFVNYEHTTDLKDNALVAPDLGVAQTIQGTNTFNYLTGRIDQHWSNAFRSSIRVNIGQSAIERQGGGLEGGVLFPSAGSVQDRNAMLVATTHTYISGSLVSETNVQYSRFLWDYARPLIDRGPQAVLLNPSEEVAGIIGSPDFTFQQLENSIQFKQTVKYYLPHHTLKAGANIIRSNHSLLGGGNPEGNYRVKLTTSQLEDIRSLERGAALSLADIPTGVEVLSYAVELRPTSIDGKQTVYSAFVEDRWMASRHLTVTAGVRYDYDDLSRGGAKKGDRNNISPRLNANYSLSPRSSLRMGYGIFYDKIPYAIYSDALQQSTTSEDFLLQLKQLVGMGLLPEQTDLEAITFDGNLSAFSTSVDFLEGPDAEALANQRSEIFSNERRILNPEGYRNPYSHQMTVGYQLQVNEQTSFFIDLVHNRSFHLLRLRNLNAAAPYPLPDAASTIIRSPAAADSTRAVPIYEGGYAIIDGVPVTGVARNIVVSESAGQSRYYAASLNYQKARGSDDYAIRINYTLSYLENNTEDINFRAMDANNFEDEWGPSINDRRHILSGILNWYPANGLTMTFAALLQSGQPINRIPDALQFGTTDLNGDGASFGDAYVGNSDRYPGEARNSDRLPWSQTFDLGISYDFGIGSGRLVVRADIFNLFNAENLSGYSNNATQSNQIQTGSASSGLLVRRNYGPPRQFQFSAQYVW